MESYMAILVRNQENIDRIVVVKGGSPKGTVIAVRPVTRETMRDFLSYRPTFPTWNDGDHSILNRSDVMVTLVGYRSVIDGLAQQPVCYDNVMYSEMVDQCTK